MKYRLIILEMMVCFVSILFASCSEDTVYNFPGSEQNKIFVKKNFLPSFQIVHNPIASRGNLMFKAPIFSTHSASEDIVVQMELDNSLVDAYNAKYGTAFEALPENALTIDNSLLTISKGEMQSSDSIVVYFNEEMIPDLCSKTGYVLPIRIAHVEGGNAAPSSNINHLFLKVYTFFDDDMITEGATEKDIIGSLLTNREGLTAYIEDTSGLEISGTADMIFDDDENSAWKAKGASPFKLVVDMQSEYDLTAISGYTAFNFQGMTFRFSSFSSGAVFECSTNSTDWTMIGTLASDMENPNITVLLSAPMRARYIRVTIPLQYGRHNMDIGNLNLYVK